MQRTGLVVAIALAVLEACWLTPPAHPAPVGPPAVWYIGFSTRLPPAESLAFRQAIAYALDRQTIAAAVAPHGPAQPATTIQHPELPSYSPSIRGYTFDAAKARDLLARSGWNAPITLLAPPSPSYWVEALEEAMVRSISRTLSTATAVTLVANFDALVRASRSGSAPMWTYAWYSDRSDYGYPSFPLGLAHAYFLSDPEIKAAVDRLDAVAVEQMLLDKALLIPVVHYRYSSN
jgi:ABC-type transport system substrate-binding protein